MALVRATAVNRFVNWLVVVGPGHDFGLAIACVIPLLSGLLIVFPLSACLPARCTCFFFHVVCLSSQPCVALAIPRGVVRADIFFSLFDVCYLWSEQAP